MNANEAFDYAAAHGIAVTQHTPTRGGMWWTVGDFKLRRYGSRYWLVENTNIRGLLGECIKACVDNLAGY